MDTNNVTHPAVIVASTATSLAGSTVSAVSYHLAGIDPHDVALYISIISGFSTSLFTLGVMAIGVSHFIKAFLSKK